MIAGYFKLVMLEDTVKQANKIKVGASVPRYDCTVFSGICNRIKPFVNHKGMFYLRLMESREFIKADKRRLAEFVLVGNKSLNFSSMYAIGDNCYYGNPNGKPFLKDGSHNPMFPFRKDLYIILTDDSLSQIEVFVLPNQKGYALELAQAFEAGDYDDKIEELRANVQTFCNYE